MTIPVVGSMSLKRQMAERLCRGIVVLCIGSAVFLAGCERTESVQRGYRGTGMELVYSPADLAKTASMNTIPEPEPVDPPDPEAPLQSEVYKNVQVLNDLTVLEFSRLMAAMSTWIAPEEGCSYCHNSKNLASDEKYPKVVARRMLEMTRKINTEWKQHVAGTGVTCWTCHRGQAVPSGDWFKQLEDPAAGRLLGSRFGQNMPGVSAVANTSLPSDPLSDYLSQAKPIRVQGTTMPAGENRNSVKQAEATYGLMIYMSKSLGVNCTYCHNTRAFASWPESSPQRVTAWYGIRMVRELNNDYLTPLTSTFPANRLSAEGDGPKVGCQTCHKGVYKPLFGVSMLADYPELAGVMKDRPAPAAPAAATMPVVAPGPAAAAASAPAG